MVSIIPYIAEIVLARVQRKGIFSNSPKPKYRYKWNSKTKMYELPKGGSIPVNATKEYELILKVLGQVNQAMSK